MGRLTDWIPKYPFRFLHRTFQFDTRTANVGDTLIVSDPQNSVVDWGPGGGGPSTPQASLIWPVTVSGDANPVIDTYFQNVALSGYPAHDTVPSNYIFTEFTADLNEDVTIGIELDPPHRQDQWNPILEIVYNGGTVEQITLSKFPSDRRFWASHTIQLTGSQTITLRTNDGGEFLIVFNAAAAPPVVTSAVWNGNYPAIPWDVANDQTAVKEDDVIVYEVSVDVDAEKIFLDNYQLGSLTEFQGPWLAANNPHSLPVVCTGSTNNGTRWYAQSAAGTNGPTELASNGPIVDQNEVQISITNRQYPIGQFALKNQEACVVSYNLTNWADGPGGNPPASPKYVELDNDTENQVSPEPPPSTVGNLILFPANDFDHTWYRIAGDYYTGNNCRVRAFKSSNGSRWPTGGGWVNTQILIANVAAQLTIREGNSGSNPVTAPSNDGGKVTDVGIVFNQLVQWPVFLLRDQTDSSQDPAEAVTPATNTDVYDSGLTQYTPDNKGNFQWYAGPGGVFANNLAGIPTTLVTTNPAYDLEGFDLITVSRPGFTFTREFELSTQSSFVVDVNATTAERFKDPIWDPLTLVTFTPGQDVTDPGVAQSDAYTITNGAGQYDPNGNHFYWLDKTQSDLGLAETFRIQES